MTPSTLRFHFIIDEELEKQILNNLPLDYQKHFLPYFMKCLFKFSVNERSSPKGINISMGKKRLHLTEVKILEIK